MDNFNFSNSTRKKELNVDDAIEVANGIFWVGFNDTAKFNCNAYLVIDNDEAVLIDPGSVPQYPLIAQKILTVFDPNKINYLVLQHQDPDICGALPYFEELINNPNLKLIAHAHAATFIYYYGIKSPFIFVNENNNLLTFDSGRQFRFVSAHYLHTVGVFATYETKNKILFSSDVFGDFSRFWKLYAEDEPTREFKYFHEFYMPSQKIMHYFLDKIEQLDIEIIAPQHGSLIVGKDKIKKYINCLRSLKYGQAENF